MKSMNIICVWPPRRSVTAWPGLVLTSTRLVFVMTRNVLPVMRVVLLAYGNERSSGMERAGDQLGTLSQPAARIDHQHVRHAADDRHRGEVLFTVVRQLLKKYSVGDLRRASWFRTGACINWRGSGPSELGADQAGCARLIVDDDACRDVCRAGSAITRRIASVGLRRSGRTI